MKIFSNKDIDTIYDKIQELKKYGDSYKIIYYVRGEHMCKYALLKGEETNEPIPKGAIVIVSSIEE